MQTLPYSIPSIIAYTPGAAVGGVRSVNQTADVNNSSNTTPSDVTGLSFALVSGTRYYFKFVVQGRSAATTTGLGFCFSAPAMTFSHFKIKNQQGNAGTDQFYESSSDDDLTAVLVNASVIANNTDYIFIIEGICQPSANGTLQLRCRSEVDTSQITVKNGIGYLVDPDLVAGAPIAHKDSHDPQDGSDPLDTAAAAEISAVVAAGAGSSHSLARADHIHAIGHGITDNHIVTVDDASAADNEYAKFTADGVEGRTYAEVRTDLGIREVLTADRMYYVRTDGHDTASGLNNTTDATTGAFLTPQHAYDVIKWTLDKAGFTTTVQIGDGTYTTGINIADPWMGGGKVIFQGNTGNKNSVFFDTTDPFLFQVNCVLPAPLEFRFIKTRIDVMANWGAVFYHNGAGILRLGDINFYGHSWYDIIATAPGSYIDIDKGYEISGATQRYCHIYVNNPGAFLWLNSTTNGDQACTVSDAPDFDLAFVYAEFLGGLWRDGSFTYSGAATGQRYFVDTNAVVQVYGGGANIFPGDVAGDVDNGGIYK